MAPRQFDTTKSDGQYRKPVSNERLMRLMHQSSQDNEEFKFTPFAEGLKESVDWFIENYHQARTGQVTVNDMTMTSRDHVATKAVVTRDIASGIASL
jgi:hypothetical protein